MIWIVILLALIPFSADAEENATVVINEIAWMGSSVNGVDANQYWRYEWLELYNTKDISFKLEGWNIELYRGDKLYFMIPLAGTIFQDGYFLIAASGKIPNADVNYANLGGKLVNSGMRVTLKNSIGEVVDEVDVREGWPAGDNETKRTMERKKGSDPSLWQTSAAKGGTPKSQNSEGLKKPTPEVFSFANKKDPSRSFLKESVFSFPVVLAFLLSLGSGVGILGLRRLLFRRA